MKQIIYKFLRYFNYALIIGLILSYLSIYIDPGKIWFFAFFGLAYPFLLLANIFFVIFWIVKKKKFFIVPLLALLIGWNYLSSLVQFPLKSNISKVNNKDLFSIMSYNVRLFDLYDWNKGTNTSGEIFDFINSSSPDIICFQEFYAKNTGNLSEASISSLLNNEYQSHIDYLKTNSNSNYGIATYSRFQIVNRGVIQFKNSLNTSIYTDVIVNKDTIRVFNNHLQSIRFNRNNYYFINNSKNLNDDERIKEIKDISFRLRDAFIKRAGQAKILSQHIKNSPYPVLICGDFNDVPVSYAYHIIQNGLKDSFREAGKGIGNTYLGKFPSFRIDYILHNKVIECVDYNVPKVELSDHYPVTGKFYLNHNVN